MEQEQHKQQQHDNNKPRDPVLQDDGFSLRFGNPIQEIRDTPRREPDTFEPSKEHMPVPVAAGLAGQPSLVVQGIRKRLQKKKSFERDWTNYAEFTHYDHDHKK